MNIIHMDFLFPKGHLNLEINQITRLSKVAKVTVLSCNNRYVSLPQSVDLIEHKYLTVEDGKLNNRITSLRSMIVSSYISKKLESNCLFVSSFETMTFAIGRLLLGRKNRILLVHHFNTDELRHPFKKKLFKSYMNKVEHVVLADFIKEHLVKEYSISPNRVHVIPHHLNSLQNTTSEYKYDCVGLSNSNDQDVINEIVEMEKEFSVIKSAKRKVILKSKDIDFDNGYLKVISGFLDQREFDDYIKNTRAIYMPFPISFKFRMSGTLIDALSNDKIVFGSEIPAVKEYSKKYPGLCNIIVSAEEFLDNIVNLNANKVEELEAIFKKFKADHSEKKIEESFAKILNQSLT